MGAGGLEVAGGSRILPEGVAAAPFVADGGRYPSAVPCEETVLRCLMKFAHVLSPLRINLWFRLSALGALAAPAHI